jgi:hypothetical protein
MACFLFLLKKQFTWFLYLLLILNGLKTLQRSKHFK